MFWLFDKYKGKFEYTEMSSKYYRLNFIRENTNLPFSNTINDFNSLLEWDCITPNFGFFYDYENNELDLQNRFYKSVLKDRKFLFIETTSSDPIIKVPVELFINNWEDFIVANQGMGSVLLSNDLDLCLEFTDDHKYFLFSNFKI